MPNQTPMISLILGKLKQVSKSGLGFHASCPTHNDRDPSLRINPGVKGWLMHCHKGCPTKQIMAELGLPIQMLFYDYKDTAHQRFSPIVDQNFSEWMEKSTVYKPCWKLHRFDDVLWAGIQREPARFARAGAEWSPMTGYPFEEAMTMWVILSDGWLHEWLGELYLTSGMDWKETKLWVHQRTLETWIAQGCSTCPSVESPRPVLG